MGDGAACNYIAMAQAIADAGLEPGDVSNERTGLIRGSGGPSTKSFYRAHTFDQAAGAYAHPAAAGHMRKIVLTV